MTLLVYLNDVPAGGETAFPAAAAAAAAVEEKQEDRRSEGTWELEGAQRGSNGEKKFDQTGGSGSSGGGLRVSPERGSAVLFYNLDAETLEPDPAAVHQALPVIAGENGPSATTTMTTTTTMNALGPAAVEEWTTTANNDLPDK